jgi:hypothetical protein
MDNRPVGRATFPTKKQGVVEVASGPDLLLYDPETKRAFRLNATAAAVWQQCDGALTEEEIAAGAAGEALSRLIADGLVQVSGAATGPRAMTRGSFMRAGAAVAAGGVALPLIQSIVVPAGAHAAGTGCISTCGPSTTGTCCVKSPGVYGTCVHVSGNTYACQ